MTGNIIVAILSGAVLASAFPRPGLWPLAFVGLSPLLVVLRRTSLMRSAALGLIAGFTFFGILLYWVNIFGTLPWILLSLVQSLYIVVFAVAYRLLNENPPWVRLIVAPSIWTALEWVRSLGFIGFTWGDLAISQYRNPPFIQLAAVTGTWGLSYLLMMSNVAVADTIAHWRSASRKRSIVAMTATAAVLLLAHGYGWMRLSDINPGCHRELLRVALVQGSFDQDLPLTEDYTRKVMEVYSILTHSVARFNPQLVVWPETTIPGDFPTEHRLWEQISTLAKERKADLLVGGSAYAYPLFSYKPFLYNGAFLFNNDGEYAGNYYKVHLVPFGEVVPLRKYMPLLERYCVRDEDYRPGPGFLPIRQYGVMICFESIFPEISREMVRKGAKILVVMTNDGWFKRTAAPEQHLAFSVFRAVENGRWLARNAATGISCIIDPRGHISGRLGLWRRGVVKGEVGMGWPTFYGSHGEWFALMCLALSGIWLAVSALIRLVPGSRREIGSYK